MKGIIKVLIVALLLTSCKTQQNKESESLLIYQSSKEVVHEVVRILPVCDNLEKDIFKQYKTIVSEPISYTKKLDQQFYYAITKENFNTLFSAEKIKCVIPARSHKFNFYNIYYNEKGMAKKIFINLQNIGQTADTINKYHDFFKRGLVYILNTEENSITLIAFNVFRNNDVPDKIKHFFKTNEHLFESVFMTTGIGTTEVLIDR